MAQIINRYRELSVVRSGLDPLEDVMCWVEGLTSVKYVKDLLRSKHSLSGSLSVHKQSESVAELVTIACKYLEQAKKGPEEVSFLPLYYACLNLLKSYIVVGPYGVELSRNRWHGATYNPNRDFRSLDDDIIVLQKRGAIPLFYRTLVGQNINHSLTLKMREIYPYIVGVGAEYERVSRGKRRLLPFEIQIGVKGENQRIEASYIGMNQAEFAKVRIGTLQVFRGLRRESKGSLKLASKWYSKNDTASMMACLRPAMLYGYRQGPFEQTFNFVPSSSGKLLLPEELPLICAFFHMSAVVRYNPDGLQKLMDSKYWPVLLVLRRHGLYRFLILFWSFITQCCTYIEPD